MKMPERAQQGFSLIELMIAVLLGLLVLAGVTSIFLGSKQSFRTHESVSQVQEGGRFLGYVFYPYLRLAGHLSNPLTQTVTPAIFRRNATEGLGTPPSSAIADAKLDPAVADPNPAVDVRRALWGVDNAENVLGVEPLAGTDVIVVRYMGSADGTLSTCVGGAAVAANQMAENVFFVGQPDAGLSSLSCRAAVWTLNLPGGGVPAGAAVERGIEPLVTGVQDMQILYGQDTDNNGTPNIYRTANQVTNWQQISSVRITTVVDAAEQTEGADAAGVAGRRVRRTFTNTIQIRNLLRSS